MSKPEDVPQDVWDEATQHVAQIPIRSQRAWDRSKSIIARAIMAAEKRGEERERGASRAMLAALQDIAKQWPDSSAARTARPAIAAAIRNRTAS